MAFGNSFGGGVGGGAIADGSITAPKLSGAQTGSAPIYGCRAWVNFDGSGAPSIRASGNVSSITDNGVGDYTINFTTAMPDANYAMVGSSYGLQDDSHGVQPQSASAFTASSVRVNVLTDEGTVNGGVPFDSPLISVIILR